ncbi:MAG: malate/lactate/ureidoglycolate dehydrogenase [Methyloligellaceae bacterium]
MPYSQAQLEALVIRILTAAGATASEAAIVASNLARANMVGHDSHGVIRVAQYVDQLTAGEIVPGAEAEVTHDFGAVTLIDGHRGLGQPMAAVAIKHAVEKARSCGVSLTALRNCGHVGRLGHWAEMASQAGVISLQFVNSQAKAAMVPFGGRERRMATNPICAGFPVAGDGSGLIADMTTSSVAEGKLRVAHAAGKSVPEGWIVDAEGRPTTDPGDFYAGGAMLPVGGHKGYALGLVVDLFAGALSLGGATNPVATANTNNLTVIAIDPAAYGAAEATREIASAFLDYVRSSPPVDPEKPVMIPGEPEALTAKQREAEGVELPAGVWEIVTGAARSAGLSEADLEAVLTEGALEGVR